MCCKSSYNKSSIFRRNFRMFSFWGSWFLSNMFPLSFAEVKYQYKNATNMFFVCFWRRKSNIFSFFLKNCKTSREKKKHPNPVEAPKQVGQVWAKEGNDGLDYLKSMKSCLANSWGLASSQMPKQTGPKENIHFPHSSKQHFYHSLFSNGNYTAPTLHIFKEINNSKEQKHCKKPSLNPENM